MKIKSCREFAETFFLQHKDLLQKNYPGLSPERLLRALKEELETGDDEALVLDPYHWIFQALMEGVPLERLSQEKFFYNALFYVNQNVLIPRNETEVLVDLAITHARKNVVKSIAEVGVGSGCILLSILREVSSIEEASAIDLDPKALDVFEINYFRLRKSLPSKARIGLFEGDRLKDFEQKVDMIVSNPPYIDRGKDRDKVHWQTDRYEPEMALYLDHETYNEWFDVFFSQAKERLNKNGSFIMEGHEDKWSELQDLANKHFDSIEVINDLAGSPRFLKAGVK